MTLTMFLIGLVFVAFVAALVVILSATHQSDGVIIFFPVVLGLGLGIGSLFYSDKIALRAAGARVVTPQQAPELHGIIDRLCALADMPKPVVAIAPTSMPNAFATGRSSKHAVVCVTEGILGRLDREELEGVIAHEMSHVAHKDVVVMTVESFLAIIAGLMIRFAFYSELFGGGRGGRNNNNGGAQVFAIMAVVMLVSVVIYAISFLLIRLLSRYRELAADRSGALLTGQPSKLASALQKVSGAIAQIPTKDLRANSGAEALNAFYFAPALTKGRAGGGLATVFSTHPSLEKRLEQLAKISEQLGQ
jgi:heat shock protein HtpX